PYSLRALAHAGESPMPISPGLQNLGIDSTAIVANRNIQPVRGVFQHDFNAAGLRMPEGIHQGLAADAVHLIANHWFEWKLRAFHRHLEVDAVVFAELLPNSGKSLFQVVDVVAGGSKTAHGVASFVHYLTHQFQNATQSGRSRRSRRKLIHGYM